MKKVFIVFSILILVFAVSCKKEEQTQAKPAEIVSEVLEIDEIGEKYYWLMGYSYAQLYSQNFEDFDSLAFAQGFVDYHYGYERLTPEERNSVYGEYVYGDNLKEAEEFLAQNKSNEGVKETKSGLQYRVEVQGSGSKPTEKSTVNVDYTLTLLDGQLVDQGEGISFPLTGVIKGFAEGLELMNPGSTYTLWIHPDLGYGASGTTGMEGNELLIFTVTLNFFEN